MLSRNILFFGYGRHGKFIANRLHEDGLNVKIIESNLDFCTDAKEDGFDALHIDVTNDEELKALNPEKYAKIVCVMDDGHLNVFLTLSLRSLFVECYILSLSDSVHTTKKLQMAGANNVIDLYEESVSKIHNILKRPVVTKLLEKFVTQRGGISFQEMLIPENSFLVDRMTDDIDFSPFGVLLVGMIDKELGNAFVFITAGINHRIDVGDTLVCMGDKEKLEAFEEELKRKP